MIFCLIPLERVTPVLYTWLCIESSYEYFTTGKHAYKRAARVERCQALAGLYQGLYSL